MQTDKWSGRLWSRWPVDRFITVFAAKELSPTPGVYALQRNGVTVYVGRGADVRLRIMKHRRTFRFDTVKYAEVESVSEQKRLERKLIFRLRPCRNSHIPTDLHQEWLRGPLRRAAAMG